MKRRFSEEQIIGILKQHEGGLTVAEVCRQHKLALQDVIAKKA